MILLVAFAAGVITAVSPCVFPVLPIVLAGGANEERRRPYAIVAGLVLSFSVSILFVAWILDKLGLPQDLLRNVAIALLFVLAASLIFPEIGRLLERPFVFLTRLRPATGGGGFVLGLSLGLVFVPCGGPTLGYVSAQAATVHFGLRTILITVAYALGAAVPLLAIAIGGRNALGLGIVRRHGREVRAGLGVVMAAAALLIVFGVDKKAQQSFPDYTHWLQKHTEGSAFARRLLHRNSGHTVSATTNDYGPAADFTGIDRWLNTPGGKPLSIRGLRGKVVLVDFWTYSCINCLRTLPHLEAWYAHYHHSGFEIVGVHTPEFAFEHVPSNVRQAVHDLGIRYPVALDNGYSTWGAYRNQAWPAEYLVDRNGRIQEFKEGEGDYGGTETKIRKLLGQHAPAQLASAPDLTPTELTTPETYLGYARLARFVGSRVLPDTPYRYRVPRAVPQNALAYGGTWTVEKERILAHAGARLVLHFVARNVYLVAGGHGSIQVLVNGKPVRTLRISGISRLYTVLSYPQATDGLLELRFSPGLAGYSFTFG